ncbi:protein lingerer isoform X2 [Homalodisca vitripennis]|uniref:protein lingerer isoform X2 n=1 Tax=Homalodisca vitripennis TaxID=197043 RepID=UPI001EEAE428|nr:protein lingerer isoform X2 [Homalodisca vitripennis]
MSATARSTPRGGKNAKVEATSTPKTQKLDVNKTETPKVIGLDKSQVPTAEQMRMAEIMDTKKDDLVSKDIIKQVMDLTQKTEDEALTALHDCDYDVNRAINYLLEGSPKVMWSTSVMKKKKNRTASTNKAEGPVNNHVGGNGEEGDWEPAQSEVSTTTTGGRGRERPRQRGSGPPRLRGRGSMESRGWRGRENKENERNLEDNYNSERGSGGGRRGERGGRMSNGPGRGGRGGRGGGRLGSRTFQSRDKPGQGFPRSIDTWNNPSAEDASGEKMENWDNGPSEDWDAEEFKNKNETWEDGFPSPEDWDNEEYTGSLADSKVFTASSGPEPTTAPQPLPAEPPVDASLPECDQTATAPPQPQPQPLVLDMQPPQVAPQPQARPPQMTPSPVAVGTLTPAQTQYLNQLAQSSESYKSAVGLGVAAASFAQQPPTQPPQQYPAQYPPTSVPFSSSYGVTVNSYSSSLQDVTPIPTSQPLPARTKQQKPRVPPPSKIPSSAVEMPPGDAIAVALLDVQFGGLEFGSDTSSLDTSTTLETTGTTTTAPTSVPAPSAPTSTSVAASVASIMESYATSVSNTQQQTNLANALAQTQKLTPGESMLQAEAVVTQGSGYNQQSTPRPVNTAVSSVLTELSNSTAKSSAVDTTLSYNSTDSNLYQSQAYQKPTAAATYQTPVSVSSTYNSSSYSTSQVTSSSTGYSSQTTGYTNSGSYGNNAVSQSAPSSYPSYSGNQTSASAYYTSYPANNYHSSGQQTYPYQSGGATYPYQNSNYPPSATQQNHKINAALNSTQGKDSQYESGQVSNSSIPAVSTVSSAPSLGLSATSQTVASTKVTALSTANKSGIVANIPPQVPPMINTQYIMSQAAGLPYFQQPMFSYDDALMLQQRIAAGPPMPAGYFDMSFQQQPTSLGTGRDGSLGNVAYSMSDGRFARADNNASPVPSTLSQQTQGHQQPMLNPTGLPPGYTYIYGSFPTNFQYGTPALYPMAPTAAAGNSTSGQYKAPTYGSAAGYSSGYEAGTDGYKVGSAGYTGSPAQTKASGTPTTSSDMYTKGHATLNKVNSYDKAVFHSGTPPPFNLGGSQSAGLAHSGTYAPPLFISTLPPHQQHAHSAATLMHSHQPLHQIEMRNHGRRMDGASNAGPRSQATSQPNKAATKQPNYSPSFWATSS